MDDLRECGGGNRRALTSDLMFHVAGVGAVAVKNLEIAALFLRF